MAKNLIRYTFYPTKALGFNEKYSDLENYLRNEVALNFYMAFVEEEKLESWLIQNIKNSQYQDKSYLLMLEYIKLTYWQKKRSKCHLLKYVPQEIKNVSEDCKRIFDESLKEINEKCK